MPIWLVGLHSLNVLLLLLGGYILATFKTATQKIVETIAEEGTKAEIRDLTWQKDLARELQKSRGLERQELRFRSYGSLWKELRPLAIYDVAKIDKAAAAGMFSRLTDWYFSECGGLLLTPQARDFYFAMQDLLRKTSRLPDDWSADRSAAAEGEAEKIFRDVLHSRNGNEAVKVLDYFKNANFENWQQEASGLAKKWRGDVDKLPAVWSDLNESQRFAILQQVGSKLRSSLAIDLESRER